MPSKRAITRFRDLVIGDEFDFIPPAGKTSFYNRCVKISDRCYRYATNGSLLQATVGTVNVKVYHVISKGA